MGELYSKKAIDYGFIAVDVKPKSTTPKDQTPDSQTFYSICFVNWKRSLVARLESYVLFKPKDDFSNKVLAFESDLLNGLLTAYPRLQQIQWKDIPSDLQPHHHRPE